MKGSLTLSKNTFSERKPTNHIQIYDDNILNPSTSTDLSVEANISHPSISAIGNVLSPCASVIKKMFFRKMPGKISQKL
ncbi:unnamed protein product [Parnassius apollo]|uniref:(apollo) hypothetical protein n=1 Tax=Parnassius apollo TaxID=110799 RepID=A0A8S3YB81_PARAO|nr:unnamed protein product [Parnassius apollo]